MEGAKPIAPKWAWFNASMVFLIVALVLQRLGSVTDTWFAKLGVFAFTGLVFDLGLVFVAAMIGAGLFMRRYGPDQRVRRKMTQAYAITFGIWLALSFLLTASLWNWAPVVWAFGALSLGEAAVGALAIWGAVVLCGRLFERNNARRAALGGVS
jgi:hypothetical protein